MKYTLLWCPELAIFRLTGPDGFALPKTEEELINGFKGDPALMEWLEFAKKNPNTSVEYQMLPA